MQNIDNGVYGPYDQPRNWDSYGIKLVGDREKIDAGLPLGQERTKMGIDLLDDPEDEA